MTKGMTYQSIPGVKRTEYWPQRIVKVCADACHVTMNELRQPAQRGIPRRHQCREIAMWLMRRLCMMSDIEIGKQFKVSPVTVSNLIYRVKSAEHKKLIREIETNLIP